MKHTTPAVLPAQFPLQLAVSERLLNEATQTIPGLTLSMMKRPEHFAPGRFPTYLRAGAGARVIDVDENEYVDFICGLGANSLGHAHPAIVSAITSTLETGLLHSLPHSLELEAAKSLIEIVPNAEMARFFKTGADATSAAIRLARHLTKKQQIITIGYNGWHDHFMFDTPGVPEVVAQLTTRLPLFVPDQEAAVLSTIEAQGAELAAVLLSVPYNRILSPQFLSNLRDTCSKWGVKLIFDEIVSGLRVALGGIQELYGVSPDYSCYSKAIAAGMPLSAVVGPRDQLEAMAELQVSTTFGGELLSLAAAKACIQVHREQGVIEHISSLGRSLKEGVNRVASDQGSSLRVVGYDAIPMFLFDPAPDRHVELMRQFQGHMAQRGVLLRRDVNFICAAHTPEQTEMTISAASESLRAMK